MGNKEILQEVTTVFKRTYPGLSAEAIICFLVALDLDSPTVGDIARAVGMTEPAAYQHLSLLTASGAGLVSLENTGDGRNLVHLTDAGNEMLSTVSHLF